MSEAVGPTSFYGTYFQQVRVLERLLPTRASNRWLLSMPEEPSHTENLLYLGCNVLRTPNLAEDLIAVLDDLGVDYRAVGGPTFCCGAVHRGRGDIKPSERLFSRSMSLFDCFTPRRLIEWCPSCEEQLDWMLNNEGSAEFSVQHATEFLLEEFTGGSSLGEVGLRVAVHAHTTTERSVRETASALALLRLIPGLHVEQLPADPLLGAHCSSTGCVAKLGRSEYERIIDGEILGAERTQCDAIVSIYHSCHRELCRRSRGRMPVLNYSSLVCKALGLPTHEDRYARYMRPGGLEAAREELMPRVNELNLSERLVDEVLVREFGTPQ